MVHLWIRGIFLKFKKYPQINFVKKFLKMSVVFLTINFLFFILSLQFAILTFHMLPIIYLKNSLAGILKFVICDLYQLFILLKSLASRFVSNLRLAFHFEFLISPLWSPPQGFAFQHQFAGREDLSNGLTLTWLRGRTGVWYWALRPFW